MRTKGAIDFWNEKGCDISIDIVPIYEESTKTTFNGLSNNVTFSGSETGVDNVSSYGVYNIKNATSSSAQIISGDGKNANYVLPSFDSGKGVDLTDFYNNTHMLAVVPKYSQVYTAAAGGGMVKAVVSGKGE